MVGLILLLLLAGCTQNESKEPQDPPTVAANNKEAEQNDTGGSPDANTEPEQVTAPEQLVEPEVLLEGQYAFADEAGKRLLTLEGETPVTPAQKYAYAIGPGGSVLPIAFANDQPGDEQGNGRQTMANFDHLAGAVYTVTEGAAEPNATYFLTASDAWSHSSAALSTEGQGEQATEALIETIATAKNRPVQYAAKVGDVETERVLYLVQFERQGDDMLASLVLQQGDQLSYYDMPAVYNEGSTWRVDDGGEIHAEQFALYAAADTAKGLLLGLAWIGAEGENAFFLLEDGAGLKEAGGRVGRYMAPE